MRIGVMLTDTCNFQCKHCMMNSTLDRHLIGDNVLEKFYSIVEANNPDTVCIVGGEPLLFLDKVKEVKKNLKGVCNNFLVYSNGTFLLNSDTRDEVKDLGIEVRISKTRFHKNFWTDDLESLIDESPYWKVEALDDIIAFPRGRALENRVYTNMRCPCSLYTESYSGFWHNDRFLVMQDGSVNIWCPCMGLELANVFKDKDISLDLLISREKKFREYLLDNDLLRTNMLYMCNKICGHYKVTVDGIFKDDSFVCSL